MGVREGEGNGQCLCHRILAERRIPVLPDVAQSTKCCREDREAIPPRSQKDRQSDDVGQTRSVITRE